jgi:hypothetical protein
MGQDEVEQTLPGWQVASQAVARELAEWRGAHPKATLAEIEHAVFEAMQTLQARALGQVVHASAVTDVAAQPSVEWPYCPMCGGQLEPCGRVVACPDLRVAAGLDATTNYVSGITSLP